MIIKLKPQPIDKLIAVCQEILEWFDENNVNELGYDIVLHDDTSPYVWIDGRMLKGPNRTEFILRWANG